MTHIELLSALMKKLPRLNREEGEVLKNIVSEIAKKDNSLFEFYEEVTTEKDILSLPVIKRIAEKYSVPELYKDHIRERFLEFKQNIMMVCDTNKNLVSKGRSPGLDPDKWMKGGVSLFSSTEKKTIETAGGLEMICRSIHNVGYFDYLFKLYKKSATEVSKIKYSLLMSGKKSEIEYKR